MTGQIKLWKTALDSGLITGVHGLGEVLRLSGLISFSVYPGLVKV